MGLINVMPFRAVLFCVTLAGALGCGNPLTPQENIVAELETLPAAYTDTVPAPTFRAIPGGIVLEGLIRGAFGCVDFSSTATLSGRRIAVTLLQKHRGDQWRSADCGAFFSALTVKTTLSQLTPGEYSLTWIWLDESGSQAMLGQWDRLVILPGR